MKVRKLRKKDIKSVIKLALKSYKEFVAPSFTKRGRKSFEKGYEERFKKKITDKKKSHYVAVEGSKIIGIVGGEIKGKIAWTRTLAVDKKHHGEGIGRKLTNKIEKVFSKKVKDLRLNSSIYAIKFYEKLGYKKTRGIVNSKGVIYQPMRKFL